MALDGLMLSAVARELQPLIGSKISKIQNLSDEEILFNLHGGKSGNFRLIINVHSNTNRLYLVERANDFQQTPTNFVMVLRKRLSQGIITNIEQIGYDRLVRFDILGHNELQDQVTYALYAEMMGKYANLVLVDPTTETIIDCLKRIPVYENSKRLIHPGAHYTLPEVNQPFSPDQPFQADPDRSLTSQIQGFSPLLSREVLHRMKNGEKFEDIVDQIIHSDSLYLYGSDCHVIPLTIEKGEPDIQPLMKGLNQLYSQNEKKIRIQQQCGDVFKAVAREKKKALKKLPKLEASLEESMDDDKYRLYGDLLFIHMYDIKKAPTVELEDYETGNTVSIPIDMRFDLKTNANLFYKKYHKLRRGQEILQEQIEKCQEEIDYYSQLEDQLKFCSIEDAMEIREELAANRILMARKGANRKKKPKAPHVLHLKVDGADIYAGKNNIQNNYITWKLGRKNDLWFHTQGYHGSHVLLVSDNPTETQIRAAAMTAAWFSKSRESSSVPVDYTKISQLKKVPGSKIGFVTMKSQKTIYIDPDQSVMEELIAKNSVRH